MYICIIHIMGWMSRKLWGVVFFKGAVWKNELRTSQAQRAPLCASGGVMGTVHEGGAVLSTVRRESGGKSAALHKRLLRLGGGGFGGVDELADFGALLFEVGQMLLADFLVLLELVLGAVLFAGVDVGLAQAVVGVG